MVHILDDQYLWSSGRLYAVMRGETGAEMAQQVESVDVARLWQAQFVTPPRRPPVGETLGPRGWTLAVAEVLAPYTTSVHGPLAYHDNRPTGSNRTVHEVNGDDGLLRFAGVGAEAASAMLDRLTHRQLARRHGDAPSLGSMLQSAVDHPGVVEVNGYAVGPAHPDERIIAEGVFLYARPELDVPAWPHDSACDCTELWRVARSEYGLADGWGMPQELQRCESPWRPGEHAWRLWWD